MIKNIRDKFKDLAAPAKVIAHVNGWGDYLSAGLAGLAFLMVALVWAYPELHPDVWTETAVAAGLRPPSTMAGGLWRAGVGLLFERVGLDNTVLVLRLLGKVAGAFCVSIVFLLLRSLLLSQINVPLRSVIRWRWVFRGLVGLSALMFGLSAPVWRVFQQLGPEAWTVTISLVAIWLLQVFLQGNGRWTLQLAFLVLGVLSAETSVGILVTLLVVVFCMRARYLAIDPTMMLFDPLMTQQIKWRLTFMFLLGFVATAGYDVYAYFVNEGFAASGCEGGELVFRWLKEWWQGLLGLGTVSTWSWGVMVAVVPFVLSLLLVRKATDMDHFLGFEYAAFFLIGGVIAILQLAGVPQCWFWTWNESSTLATSGVLRVAFMFLCAATMELALAVAGVETWCRDYRHVATRMASDPMFELETLQRKSSGRAKVASGLRYLLLVLVPAAALLSSLWACRAVDERRILYLVNDFVDETRQECGSPCALFTDGVFDALIELRAAAGKQNLTPISLMSEKTPYTTYLAKRAARDEEDRTLFETGPLPVLRSWAHEKSQRMKDVAVQLGFETWRHDPKTLPPPLGVLARGGEVSKEESERARRAAHGFASRVLAFYYDAKGNVRKRVTSDAALRFVLEGVQWRLARIAQQRSSRFDAASAPGDAVAEADLAKKLDDANLSYQSLRRRIEDRQRSEEGLVLTPREGLTVTLKRRDFIMARRYALQILNGEPDDPYANYAMGMSYMAQENWSMAARYLERVLIKKAGDPAILNNIAVAKWKERKYEEAVKWCEQALKANPEAKDVQGNLERIRQDWEASKKKQ